MCHCLGVTRSRYYEWRNASPSARDEENKRISEKIRVIFEESRATYGTVRIKRALGKEGIKVSRRRIGGLMLEMSLRCKTKRKFRVTTDSKHKLPIAENLLNREFKVNQPDQRYVGDITYIYTQEGWLYLATVIDLFSRKVVGWSMDDNMRAELVNKALLMAIWKRKPKRGLMWHTDRGSQYASDAHCEILQTHGIKQSMSRKGNCWDNAVAESFFHTLKTELTHHIKFKTREEAKQAVFEYIEVFYNRKRMHSANDYLSPEEFELAHNFN
jgi:transposase InsO family protein